MDQQDLQLLLNNLISNWEDELTEFKEASSDYSYEKIGKYFSALANEANLLNIKQAWLVFGVNNKTRTVVGSNYRRDSATLQKLKMEVAENTEPNITFRNIHELFIQDSRVILFEIPAAPRGMPIAWQGHYYARAGESLKNLGLDKLDEIRQQTSATDWSAQKVPEATLAHLDTDALKKARESFAKKYANRFPTSEVMSWTDKTFLDRAKLTQDGYITRTTLLLLGKEESVYLLSPHPVQMTWKLEGAERAYQHFGPPFLLNTTALYKKIRNIQIRILPEDELLATELAKYDQRTVLEALHNCIAHQDYTRNSRIIVTELLDKLIFENAGAFFEGSPTDYYFGNKTPRCYRNPFLAQAMTELNMIDTMGYGIHEMHLGQARRYLPMPSYELNEPYITKMILFGGIIDPAYSRLLIQKTDLSLEEIFALDRVQKKLPIDNIMVKHLRRAKLIEGKKPNLHVSATIANTAGTKANYIRMRAQDDAFYSRLVIDYLTTFGSATRKEIDNLLMDKLSDALDNQQKDNKIGNLLSNMRHMNIIKNTGARKTPIWVLNEKT